MSDNITLNLPKEPPKPCDDSGFYQPYADFAKNLRAWLIAYGIGAPALILANKSAWDAVKGSGYLAWVGALFLSGVALQLIEAILYKHAMWHLYSGELDEEHKESRWHKIATWLSEAYMLELFFDITTVLLFVGATLFLFISLL